MLGLETNLLAREITTTLEVRGSANHVVCLSRNTCLVAIEFITLHESNSDSLSCTRDRSACRCGRYVNLLGPQTVAQVPDPRHSDATFCVPAYDLT